jgi:hypothetical protein
MNLFKIIARLAARVATDYLTMSQKNEIIRTFDEAGIYYPSLERVGPGLYEGEIDKGIGLRVKVQDGQFLEITVNGQQVPDIKQAVEKYKELILKPEKTELSKPTSISKKKIHLVWNIKLLNSMSGSPMILAYAVPELKGIVGKICEFLSKNTFTKLTLKDILKLHSRATHFDSDHIQINVEMWFEDSSKNTYRFTDGLMIGDKNKFENLWIAIKQKFESELDAQDAVLKLPDLEFYKSSSFEYGFKIGAYPLEIDVENWVYVDNNKQEYEIEWF